MSVAVVLLALLPAAAAAQSAGDEQYTDPFGNSSQPKAQSTPAPAAPTQPAQPAQAPATSAPAQPAPAAAAAAAAPTLPRTGHAAWLQALLGLAFLSAGVALRAHARRAS